MGYIWSSGKMKSGKAKGDICMRLTLRNGLYLILGIVTSLSMLWYGLYPHEIYLEYIGFVDTDVDGEYWNQYTEVGYGMLRGIEATDLPSVDFSKNYLVVSRNREIGSMTFARISRLLWPYREAYQAKVRFKGENIPGRLHMYRSPQIRCANIG